VSNQLWGAGVVASLCLRRLPGGLPFASRASAIGRGIRGCGERAVHLYFTGDGAPVCPDPSGAGPREARLGARRQIDAIAERELCRPFSTSNPSDDSGDVGVKAPRCTSTTATRPRAQAGAAQLAEARSSFQAVATA